MPPPSLSKARLRPHKVGSRHHDVPWSRRLAKVADDHAPVEEAPKEGLGRLLGNLRVDAGRGQARQHRQGVAMPRDGESDRLARRALIDRLGGEQHGDDRKRDPDQDDHDERQWGVHAENRFAVAPPNRYSADVMRRPASRVVPLGPQEEPGSAGPKKEADP